MKKRLYKSSYKELADYLGLTVSGVSQMNKKKRDLMLIGLFCKKSINSQSNLS